MVIEVETSSSGMPSNAVRMSSSESIATPVRPTSPRQRGSSESSPSWVGRSKAMREAGRAVLEQVAVALVGLLRRRVARVLAHRPQLLAVHLAVRAAREGELARLAEPLVEVVGDVVRRVQRLDLDPGVREAPRVVGADDRRDGEIVGFLEVLVVDSHGPSDYAASAVASRATTRDRLVDQLPPGDADHPPAVRDQLLVPAPVVLERTARRVEWRSRRTRRSGAARARAVDLVALDPRVRLRPRQAGLADQVERRRSALERVSRGSVCCASECRRSPVPWVTAELLIEGRV